MSDDEDRLLIDDQMDVEIGSSASASGSHSTPQKEKAGCAINSSSSPADVEMEEGELVDSHLSDDEAPSPIASRSSKELEKESKRKSATTGAVGNHSRNSRTSATTVSVSPSKAKSSGDSNSVKVEYGDNGHQNESQSTKDALASSSAEVKQVAKQSEASGKKTEVESASSFSSHSNKIAMQTDDLESDENGDSLDARGSKTPAKTPKHFQPSSESASSGVKNFLSPSTPVNKKKKMVDKSTCVLTRACLIDESLLSLKPGTAACINITIQCKAGANTLYILAKWKGKEYYGVLTDGEPVHSHLYTQKRSASMSGENNSGADHLSANSTGGHSTVERTSTVAGPGKVRGKRGGNNRQAAAGVSEKKSRHADDQMDEHQHSVESNHAVGKGVLSHDDSSPSHSSASGKFFSASKQPYELASDKSFARRCPHCQCGYRFESISEVNTHLVMAHADHKAVMCEAIATQTNVETTSTGSDPCFPSFPSDNDESSSSNRLCPKCNQQVEISVVPSTPAVAQTSTGSRDYLNTRLNFQHLNIGDHTAQQMTEEESLKNLFKVVRATCEKKPGGEESTKCSNSPSAFSDISDDGAPTLEKEENFESGKTASGADAKKTPVNEPINITTPAAAGDIGGPTLDILSPVLASSRSPLPITQRERQQDEEDQLKGQQPGSPSGKRPTTAEGLTLPSSVSPSAKSVSNPPAQEGAPAAGTTPMVNQNTPSTNIPGHLFINQLPTAPNPFQPTNFLNPSNFYGQPQIAHQMAAAFQQQQQQSVRLPAALSIQSSGLQLPSPFNNGALASPTGGSLSTGRPMNIGQIEQQPTNSQLQQRQHKIYELKQLQQQQQPSSSNQLTLPGSDGGRSSATSLLVGGECAPTQALNRPSSALPLATASPSLAQRQQGFVPMSRGTTISSPNTLAGAATQPVQFNHHLQQQQQQQALSPAQIQQQQQALIQQHQLHLQRLSFNQNFHNYQQINRNPFESPSMLGQMGSAVDQQQLNNIAQYAALFGGGNNSQLLQAAAAATSSTSQPPQSQQNPPK